MFVRRTERTEKVSLLRGPDALVMRGLPDVEIPLLDSILLRVDETEFEFAAPPAAFPAYYGLAIYGLSEYGRV